MAADKSANILTSRFDKALVYAHEAHRDQIRKGTAIPYVSHLLAVAALVLEDGGDEDEAIAALLHDTVEDQGGTTRLEDVRSKFGARVAAIVDMCSDTAEQPKPSWRYRKELYLMHLRDADSSVLRVSAADKLHNLRCILADWKRIGDRLWERFSAKKEEQLWYYSELIKIFQMRGPSGSITDELGLGVTLLRQIVEADSEIS
jgi:(p)ppGpp synthase/HD superfamily hydrolase